METNQLNHSGTTKGRYHYCEYCNKQYTRKLSFNRHVVLCEVMNQSKRIRECEDQEETDIPTIKQLYSIIQELAISQKKMEDKMEIMQKWVDNKKKKINVIDWLTDNTSPRNIFEKWVGELEVVQEDITVLNENTIIQTIINILKRNLMSHENSSPYPIACFTEKSNKIYVYVDCTDNTQKWVQQTQSHFVYMLKVVHSKILKMLCLWRNDNSDKITHNEHFAELYNKTRLKLMSFDFTHDLSMSKIRSSLYSHLKYDLKTIFEYEFEF